MRKTNLLVLLAIVLIATACAPPAASQHFSEIDDLSQKWESAFNAGDIESLVALYTDDARVLPPGAPAAQGADAVRASFEEMIQSGLKLRLETVEAVSSGDIAYRVGTYVLQTEDGTTVETGKYIDTWRKEGGSWKTSNDIWNSDAPPAPAPALEAPATETP